MANRHAWKLADLKKPKPGAPTVFSCFACGGGVRWDTSWQEGEKIIGILENCADKLNGA